MVSEVSGSGLGLFNTSRSTHGAAGSSGDPQLGRGNENVFVNTTNGNLIIQSLDENLSAVGLDLGLVRTYNSQGIVDDDNNDCWRLGTQQRLTSLTGTINTANSTITKVFGDGARIVYAYNAALSAYVSTDGDGAHDTLSWNGTIWTWTDGSARNTETYNWVSGIGRITKSIDANNNQVVYTYNGAGTLLIQAHMAGTITQDVFFDYNTAAGSTNDLEKIRVVAPDAGGTARTQTLTRYYYDGSHRLITVKTDLSPGDSAVTDNNVYTTSYTYDGATYNVTSITQTSGVSANVISKVSFTYMQFGGTTRVRTVTDGEGVVTTYNYSAVVSAGGNSSQPAAAPGWSVPAIVNDGTVANSMPRVAFDANGNGFSLWAADYTTTPATGWRDIVARRFDRATNSWGPNVVLDSGGANNVGQNLSLAVDDFGNALAAWTQRDANGRYSVYAARYTMDSNSWSAAILLETSDTTDAEGYNFTSISTAISAADKAAVSWIQSDGTANSTYVARWNGTAWSSQAAPPVETASGTARQTNVAIDYQSNVIVTWLQSDGTNDSLYYNRYNATTAAWSGAQLVESAAGNVTRSQLALDFAGNALIVWAQNGDILARRYDKTGDVLQTLFTVDTGAGAADIPVLAIDRNTGAGVVAWAQTDGTVYSVYARRFSGGGTSWSAIDSLESSNQDIPTSYQQNTGNIAVSMRGGQIAVMWMQHQDAGVASTNNTDMNVARFNGTSWSAAEIISNIAVGWGGYFTTVGVDYQGNISAEWKNSDGVTYSARYTAPGSWTGPISITDQKIQSYFVKSGTDGYGNVVMMWVSDNFHDVLARRYDKATDTWGSTTQLDLGGATGDALETEISVDTFGNAIAVWQQKDGAQYSLYANRYDALAKIWSGPSLLEITSAPVDVGTPGGFAVSARGNYAAVSWLQKNGTANEVYMARFNGTAWQPVQALKTGTTDSAKSTSIAADSSGNVVVAWIAPDAGVDSVFTNRYSSTTAALVGVSKLETTATAAQFVQVGLDTFGSGWAVWAQGGDVYATRYDKTTGWAVTPITLDLPANTNLAEFASLSVDAFGNAIAAWVQSDGTAKSVYAARYTQGGSWATAQLLENTPQPVRINPGTAVVSLDTNIHGVNAAVAWVQTTTAGDTSTASNTDVFVARSTGGAFGAAELMSNSSGPYGAYDPSVTIDNLGNTTVSFAQYNVKSQIYVNRYNVNTPWTGPSMFGTANSPAGGSPVRSAFDAAGNGIASWSTISGTTTTVYTSRYDRANNRWSAPEVRDVTSTGGVSINTSIAVDDGGNAVLAWVRHDGAFFSTYVSRYSARDGRWSTALQIDNLNQNSAYYNISDFAAAISSETNAVVTWLQNIAGGNNDVYAARWNGISWSTPTAIDNQSAAPSGLSAAIDLDGNVTVTWLQADATAASVYQNRYTATSATAGSWGAASQLDTASTATARPRVAYDGAGNAIAIWAQGVDIMWRRFDRATGLWSSPLALDAGTTTAEVPALAVDTMGNAVVTWVQSDTGVKSVYASRYTAGGSWSAPVLLENSSLPTATNYQQDMGNPVAAIRGNQAVVSWAQQGVWGSNQNSTDFYQARWNGSTWSAAEQVNTTTEGGGGFMGSVFVDYQGNSTDFYAQWQSTTSNSFVNRYVADNSYTQTTVADGFGRVTIYKHDSLGRLMSVSAPAVDGLRNETRYQYDSDGNINAVIENATGAARTTTMIYDTRGNLVITRAADGTTTRRTYDTSNQLTVEAVYRVPDVAGEIAPPPAITRYYYDSASNLRFVVSPDGRVTQHQYFGAGASNGLRQYTFVYTTNMYANAAYSISDLTTWAGTTANIANLQRTEYAYDGRGNLNTLTAYASTNAVGAGTGTPSITRYTYDQRGLLLTKIEPRGESTSGTPLDYITSYSYDFMRRVTLITEWLTSTNTRTVKSVTYDDVNNSVVTTLANGLVVTDLYDKAGRLVSETKSSGITPLGVTSFKYDANGRLIMTTLPGNDPQGGGASSTPVRTFYLYDEVGRKAGEVDPDGTLTQYVFNRLNQVIKTIRYSSLLTSSTLSTLLANVSANWSTGSVKSLVDSLAAVPGRDSANDQVTYNAYDSAGRLAAKVHIVITVNATQVCGAITQFFYTGSRLTDSVEYAFRPIFVANAAELSLAVVNAAILADTNDRRTRNFYDGDGNLTGMLDAAGYVTENKYDAAGRPIKSIQYANVTPSANPATDDFAALRPAVDNSNVTSTTSDDEEMDIVTRYYYDGQGRRIGSLDGEGYLTETVYDIDGNIAQTSRYDKQITLTITVDDFTTFTTLRNTAFGSVAHTTKFEYDGAGRVTRQIEMADDSWSDPVNLDPDGGMTRLQLDANGNGIAIWFGAFVAGVRTHVFARRYDKASNTWEAVRTLDLGTSPANTGNSSSISMDDAGNAIIAWSQVDNAVPAAYTTYAVRYTASNNSWSTAVAIESSSTQVDYYPATSLATSIAGANSVAVCWVQGDPANGNAMSTYASVWNGTSWSTAQQLDGTSNVTSNVSIAIDSSRRATAVWLETNGSFNDIRYARYSGTSWAAAAVLDSTANVARARPQVAFDASGNGVAVWVQGTDLKAQRFTVAGGWSATVTLATGAQVDKPSLAISSNGDALVAWAQPDGTALSLYAKRFMNATGTWDASASLLETSSEPVFTAWQQNSQGIFASMRGNQAAVVWTQHVAAGSASQPANIDTMMSRWTGSGWTKAEALNVMEAAWGGHLASGTIDGLGNVVGVWNKITGGTWVSRPTEGSVTTFTYDNVDDLVSTTSSANNPDARTTQARYDLLGRKTQELSAEGFAQITGGMNQAQIDAIWTDYGTQYRYDNAGRLLSSTQRVAGTSTPLTTFYYYDVDGRLRFTVDPRGHATERKYNALGQLTDEIDHYAAITSPGIGGVLDSTLLAALPGSVVSGIDPNVHYTYLRDGRLWQRTTGVGAFTQYHYNGFGQIDVQFDQIDASTQTRHDYSYDKRGALTQIKWDPVGINAIETRAYDSFGRLKQVTDARGNSSTFEYDRLGRQIATVDALTGRHRTAYDAFSRVTSAFDAYGNETKYLYNDATRRVTVITPEGVNVATEYDRFGTVLRVTNGSSTTSYTYDHNGQLKSVSDGLGSLESRTYDSLGREVSATDARGIVTTFRYDASNRLFERTVDPTGLNLTTGYAFNSDATSVYVDTIDPGSRVTRTRYDQDGRVTAVTIAQGSIEATTTNYTYDLQGHTLTVAEGIGGTLPRVTQYKYDVLGRRIEEILDPGVLDLHTQFKYDLNGNVTRTIVGTQLAPSLQRSTWYVYDANDHLIDSIDALGGVTESTYDLEGRVVATRRYATPVTVSGFGDAVGSLSPTVNTNLDRVTRTVYDGNGRAAYTIDALGGVTERTFDRNGNVIRQRLYALPVSVSGNPNVAQLQAALTTAGNDLVNVGANDRAQWTAYDERDRAVFDIDASGAVTRNTYNNAGNVVEIEKFNTAYTGATKDASALTTWTATVVAGQSYTADNDPANRVTKSWYDNLGRTRYTLDAQGYMTERIYDDVLLTTTDKAYYLGPYDISTGTPTGSVAGSLSFNAEDRITVTQRDRVGNVIKVTDSYGNYEQYTYDKIGNKLSYRNQNGNLWTYEYDALGRITYEHSPAVDSYTVVDNGATLSAGTSSYASITTKIEYNVFDDVWKRTEAYGTGKARTTEYLYDLLGRQTRTNYPPVAVYDPASDSVTRVGAAVVRTDTTPQPLYSEVTYDTLGDAVVDRDVAGNYSYRVYDKLARARYEIDAEGYVSRHDFDRFGNETLLTRYANKYGGTMNGTAISFFGFSLPTAASTDRAVTRVYDNLNRLTAEYLSNVYWYSLDTGSSSTVPATPTTNYFYNTFNEVNRKAVLLTVNGAGSGAYANTYYFRDRLGRVTREVDPMNYATDTQYDAVGNIKRHIEYALALTSPTATAYTTTPINAPGSTFGYDRDTFYVYDRLNRVSSETRYSVEFSTVSGQSAVRTYKDVVTNYAYDNVGNRVSTTNDAGAVVYSYYDALGRTRAVADMSRNLGNATFLTPIIEFRRDALGNVVQEIHYATTGSNVLATGYNVSSNSADEVTTSLRDVMGNVLRVEDPAGADRLMSYNARGDVAKEWQLVTNISDAAVQDSIVTIHQYDKLGREIVTLQPQTLNLGGTDTTPNVVVKIVMQFNAFGEVERKSIYEASATPPAPQEVFDYDNAGRLWRTNTGDGVVKVYLYDLAGRKSAEYRSRNLNLMTFTDAASATTAAAAGSAQTIRVETRFDADGHAIEQRLPSYGSLELTTALNTTVSIGTMSKPSNPNAGYYFSQTGSGSAGDPVIINFYYSPFAPVVAGQNSGGYDRNQIKDASYTLTSGKYLYWSDPPTVVGESTQTFEYSVQGSGTWTPVTIDKVLTSSGARYLGVAVGSIPNGTYDYRIRYTRAGDSTPFAIRTGTVVNPATASSVTDTTASYADAATTVSPVTSQTNDRWGNVLSVTDAAGGLTRYRYSQNDQLIEKLLPTVSIVSVSSSTGAITTTTGNPKQENHYDALGRLIGTKDGNGVVNAVIVNAASQAIGEVHADGGGKTYVYDAFGNRVGLTDELNFKTRYTYNKQNLQTKVEQEVLVGALAAGDPANFIVQQFGYDELGRRVTETDAYGYISKNWYDLRGHVRKRVTPLNETTTMVSDVYGNKAVENNGVRDTINPNGDAEDWTYDYFGRLQSHHELGTTWVAISGSYPNFVTGYTQGTLHTYTRDSGGFMTQETSSDGKNVTYTFNAAGYVTGIAENGTATAASGLTTVSRQTDYTYDVMGRHIVEQTTENGVLHQRVVMRYDAAGRLASAWDIGAGTQYNYDAQGNRTHLVAASSSSGNAFQIFESDGHHTLTRNYVSLGWYTASLSVDAVATDYWYQYDTMGQLKISRGIGSPGTVSAGAFGITFTYDVAGNRLSQLANGLKWVLSGGVYSTTSGPSLDEYQYDGAHHITYTKKDGIYNGVFHYDRAGRQDVVSSMTMYNGKLTTNSQSNVFDADGRIYTQSTYSITTGDASSHQVSFTRYGIASRSVEWDQNGSTFSNPHWKWSEGYDGSGTLRTYSVVNYSGGTAQYTMTYWNQYRSGEVYLDLGQKSARTSGTGGPVANFTTKTYDLNGNLVSFTDNLSPATKRYFSHDSAGDILTTVVGNYTPAALPGAFANAVAANTQGGGGFSRYYFANGREIGSVGGKTGSGSFGPHQDFAFNVDDGAIQPEALATPTQVVAVAGDTLRIVAQRIWGDANLWYVLADENGLSDPDAVLTAGTALRIPNQVINVGNTSDVWQPFNVGQAIGDTSPIQAGFLGKHLPAPHMKCGIVQIIVLIIAIIVTVYLDRSGNFLSSALAWMGSAAPVAQAAIAAAVGSAVGQGVGIALGAQDSFDWNQVALAAISAGVTKGISGSGAAGSSSWGEKLATSLNVPSSVTPYFASAVNGAIGSALTQGVSVAVGLQESFSWREVAISSAAAVAASSAGKWAGGKVDPAASQFSRDFQVNLVSGAAGSAVRAAVGGKVDLVSLVADSFGNAIANDIVARITSPPEDEDLSEVIVTARRSIPPLDSNPSVVITDGYSDEGAILDPETGQPLLLAANGDMGSETIDPFAGRTGYVFVGPKTMKEFEGNLKYSFDALEKYSAELADAEEQRKQLGWLDLQEGGRLTSEIDVKRQEVASELKEVVRWGAVIDTARSLYDEDIDKYRVPVDLLKRDFTTKVQIDESSSVLSNLESVKGFIKTFKARLDGAGEIAADVKRATDVINLFAENKPIGGLATFIGKFAEGFESGFGKYAGIVGKVANPIAKIESIYEMAGDFKKQVLENSWDSAYSHEQINQEGEYGTTSRLRPGQAAHDVANIFGNIADWGSDQAMDAVKKKTEIDPNDAARKLIDLRTKDPKPPNPY